jgi:phosphoglycolate phosphatase
MISIIGYWKRPKASHLNTLLTAHFSPTMHLLFDLDGTLTDSRPGIITSIRHALSENGLPVPDADNLTWCIGPPILESFRKLVGPGASEELFDRTITTYRGRYGSEGLYENSVYPEIAETLARLRADGHTLHVATSKAECYARPIVEHFGLGGNFTSINGSELDGTRANKAELIAHILQLYRIPAIDAVMIGDREHDMLGAGKNGIPAIGVLWGYGSGGELMSSGATATVRTPRLLPEALAAVSP